jgi:poly-gamma-glutamate synthesis protein (capsule biosynthesis protein)
VAYGLGNYVWYTQPSDATSVTGVLTLTLQPASAGDSSARVTDASWEAARIGPDGLPVPMTDRDAGEFDANRGSLRDCAGLAG